MKGRGGGHGQREEERGIMQKKNGLLKTKIDGGGEMQKGKGATLAKG